MAISNLFLNETWHNLIDMQSLGMNTRNGWKYTFNYFYFYLTLSNGHMTSALQPFLYWPIWGGFSVVLDNKEPNIHLSVFQFFLQIPTWMVCPQIHTHPQLVNATIFENRVFADVIKLRWGHISSGWALNPVWLLSSQGEKTQTQKIQRENRTCEDGDRG